jgi:hypothetical protein
VDKRRLQRWIRLRRNEGRKENKIGEKRRGGVKEAMKWWGRRGDEITMRRMQRQRGMRGITVGRDPLLPSGLFLGRITQNRPGEKPFF